MHRTRSSMAITCPACGREYDVTLFQFGRTIECTCGARVGQRMEEPELGKTAPAFIADAMLGRLARWLRALGYDTRFDPDADDGELARIALTEERWLLTRDRRLADEWRTGRTFVLTANDPHGQLIEVNRRFNLRRFSQPFSRCLLCNTVLGEIPTDQVDPREVPEHVRRRHAVFRRCPTCGRTYWEGSHVRRLRNRLTHLLEAG